MFRKSDFSNHNCQTMAEWFDDVIYKFQIFSISKISEFPDELKI